MIADLETETGDRFAPGTLVALVDTDDGAHGLARTEGASDLAAVLWSPRAKPREVASIEERVARALERRGPLLGADAGTDALRLIHGEADGLPGLAVDRLGPALRMLVVGRAALPLRERVLAALRAAHLPGLAVDPPVVEVLHLRERPAGELVCVRLVAGEAGALPAPLVVREGPLRFEVELGLDAPTRPRPGVGFFLDQRENRARLARRAARGGRHLNLFAHTGGFSAALLAGGAEEVWSVDLSGPYLAQLERNLERSGLPLARHHTVRREARRFLSELDPALRFDGIVLDPPTAAASGRRFWSVRRDLEPLAAAALARLAPGGFLLLTRQDRAGRAGLEQLVTRAAESVHVRLAAIEPAPGPGGFPDPARPPRSGSFRSRSGDARLARAVAAGLPAVCRFAPDSVADSLPCRDTSARRGPLLLRGGVLPAPWEGGSSERKPCRSRTFARAIALGLCWARARERGPRRRVSGDRLRRRHHGLRLRSGSTWPPRSPPAPPTPTRRAARWATACRGSRSPRPTASRA